MTGVRAGTPELREVVRVVSEALKHEVVPATTDRPQYVVRMASRLLDIVQRELDAGDADGRRCAELIRETGAADESDLAGGLIDGRFDVADHGVRSSVDALVGWRLAIARPEHTARRPGVDEVPADNGTRWRTAAATHSTTTGENHEGKNSNVRRTRDRHGTQPHGGGVWW